MKSSALSLLVFDHFSRVFFSLCCCLRSFGDRQKKRVQPAVVGVHLFLSLGGNVRALSWAIVAATSIFEDQFLCCRYWFVFVFVFVCSPPESGDIGSNFVWWGGPF